MKSHLKRIEKSQTLLINEQSRTREREGKAVYKLGFGQSPFPPPPFIVDRLRETAHLKDYSPVQGIAELREAVAQFHRDTDKLDMAPDDVLIAPGSKILIYTVLAAFTKADVLIPVPAWVSYIPQATLAGHNVIKIPTAFEGRWRLTPELLERAVKEKADKNIPSILILNYPGNPDGLTYAPEELAALAATARQHAIIIISDEIYGRLHHGGAHESIARHYPEATIVTGGLSKWCGAGGWRLGTALLPRALGAEFKEALLGIASETYSCAPMPVQMAAAAAYHSAAETEGYVSHQRRILAALGAVCHRRLADAGVRVHAPQGGFYLFLDFENLAGKFPTAAALCEQLMTDTGVALLPGSAFGMAAEHLSARLAYVDFDGAAALAASEKPGLSKPLPADFIDAYCPKTVKGIDAIGSWVTGI